MQLLLLCVPSSGHSAYTSSVICPSLAVAIQIYHFADSLPNGKRTTECQQHRSEFETLTLVKERNVSLSVHVCGCTTVTMLD